VQYKPVAKFKTVLFIVVIVPEKVYFSSADLKQVLLHFMHDVPQNKNKLNLSFHMNDFKEFFFRLYYLLQLVLIKTHFCSAEVCFRRIAYLGFKCFQIFLIFSAADNSNITA